jgi:hypothetical protein
MDPRRASAPFEERRLVVLGLLGAFVLLLGPVALVAVPPLHDYPNHLARLWLITNSPLQPPLDAVYAIDWSLATTNIGIDLLARAFGPMLGAETVGRVCVALALALPVAGAVLLGRATAGRWHVLMLAATLLGWNLPLADGFLNSQIATGTALLVSAAYAALAARPLPQAILLLVAAFGVGTIHLVGSVFLTALIAAVAVGPGLPVRSEWTRRIGRAALAAAPVPVATAALIGFAPALPGGDPGVVDTVFTWTYASVSKLVTFAAPFVTYSFLPETMLGLVLLAGGYIGLRSGWMRMHAGLGLAGIGLFAMGLLLPQDIGDTQMVDIRFTVMGAFALAASVSPAQPLDRRSAVSVAAMLLAVATLRTGWILSHWIAASRDMAAVERAVAPLPVGIALLPVQAAADGAEGASGRSRLAGIASLHTHYPARAVMLRSVFVPSLFAFAGRQPLRVLGDWRRLSAPFSSLPVPGDLLRTPDPGLLAAFPHLGDWRADFRYLLVVDADSPAAEKLPDGLDLVADEGFARLYCIRN